MCQPHSSNILKHPLCIIWIKHLRLRIFDDFLTENHFFKRIGSKRIPTCLMPLWSTINSEGLTKAWTKATWSVTSCAMLALASSYSQSQLIKVTKNKGPQNIRYAVVITNNDSHNYSDFQWSCSGTKMMVFTFYFYIL